MIFEKSGKMINVKRNDIFIESNTGDMDHFQQIDTGIWKSVKKKVIRDDGDCIESRENKIMYKKNYACSLNGTTYSKIGNVVTSSDGQTWSNVRSGEDFRAVLVTCC